MSDWTEDEMDYIAREMERAEREEQPVADEQSYDPEPTYTPEPTPAPEPIPDVEREVLYGDTMYHTNVTRNPESSFMNYYNNHLREAFASSWGEERAMKMKTRGFEVISHINRKFPFDDVRLPDRADHGSAGYDFYAPVDYVLAPGEKKTIWTDVKAYMDESTMLKIYIRSSMAIKFDIVLANQVGIIDASYYDNPENEGNIGICLKNLGDEPYFINKGDRIAQGIFEDYDIVDNDHPRNATRLGGTGSTGR